MISVRDDSQFERESYVLASVQPHPASRSLPRPRWAGETLNMMEDTSELCGELLDA